MTEHWQIFGVLVSLLAGWSLIILQTIKTIVVRQFAGLEKRFVALEKIAEKQQCLERELLEMKANLPESYVRREDFIRYEVAINAKLDRLGDYMMRANRGLE